MERTPQEEALARQIKEQFHRAFYDTIAAAIASGDHQLPAATTNTLCASTQKYATVSPPK